MHKTLIALTLAAFLPAAAYSASHKGGEHPRGPHVERLAEKLELSAQQQQQMRALFEEQREQREAMRAQMRGKVAEVLTPDQLAKMDAMREQYREKRKEKRAHRKDCGEQKADKRS